MPPVTLLQFPREIRDRIYDFVFTWKEIYPACIGENRKNACSDNPTRTPSLLLVNHQISSEAAVSYYGNRVWAGQPPHMLRFFENLGGCRNLIKVVKVNYSSMKSWIVCFPQLFGLLSCLSGLRLVKLMMMVYNLETAQKQPAFMALGLLKDHVEVAVYNEIFHAVESDNARGYTIREIIWRRAAGAKIWVQEREKLEAIHGW